MTRNNPNNPANSNVATVKVLTSRIITADPLSGKLREPFLENQTIIVSQTTGRILTVEPTSHEDLLTGYANAIDLRGKTVLPGLIDTHVHFFLHPYSETSWDDQVTRESTAERVVRAVNHAKATLLAGYTSNIKRDLGTEGAEDADISIRKCISAPMGIIPGPRYHCATRAIVATGSYGPKNVNRPYVTEVDGKSGADPASGVDECVRVVRRQIGAGADWIKVSMQLDNQLDAHLVLDICREEVEAMTKTAHSLGVKVAAHCVNAETIKMLIEAGVDTLEHGTAMTEDVLPLLVEKQIPWTPTFAAYYSHQYPGARPWQSLQKVFSKAIKMDAAITTGGDT
ncbi:14795_t:CDS:2, partial [Acaulospora colombiana]